MFGIVIGKWFVIFGFVFKVDINDICEFLVICICCDLFEEGV